MSFLYPLYIAAAATIALPIIFHLIRRTPQNRQHFSSLMFLSASPPRLSRRSRLTNILLLILRASALILLACAFARPFFYRKADLNINQSQGRRIAILVDTSASMRRTDLWNQAKEQVNKTLADVTPADEVALFLFDRQLHPAFTFEQWNQAELSQRPALLRARLDQASPTWFSTSLGEALSAVADQLAERTGPNRSIDSVRRQIVLISDLQQGSHAQALQSHEWPASVSLLLKPVVAKQSTNANLELIKDQSDAPDADAQQKLRVRVSNQPGSNREEFTVAWANDRGPLTGIEPQKVYVPPGRSRVFRIAWPAPDRHADRLVLRGDDFDFDNTLWVVPRLQDHVRIVYVGPDAPDDTRGLSYYLRSALIDTADRKIDFIQHRNADELNTADLDDARLVVVGSALSAQQSARLRSFVESGGQVLWVLPDVATAKGLGDLLKTDSIDVSEAPASDFALISRVDLEHPIFAPFADPRFGDFSKIHFWKHLRVKLPAPARTIAWFDNSDPFLIDEPIGQGDVLIASSGWQPQQSQLALSTKFVPLIGGMLRRRNQPTIQSQYTVGDQVRSDFTADAPGVYEIKDKNKPVPVALNLAPDESRTAPLASAELEQFGVKVGPAASPDVILAKQRQLQLFELENRQKMWRWLILCVLGLVAAETLLAGRLTRAGVGPIEQVPT